MNVSVVLHQAQAEMAVSTAPVASTAAIAARPGPAPSGIKPSPRASRNTPSQNAGSLVALILARARLTVLIGVQMVSLRQPPGGPFEDLTHEERGHVRGDDDGEDRFDHARAIAEAHGELHGQGQCGDEGGHRARDSDARAEVVHPLPRLVALVDHLDLELVLGKRVVRRQRLVLLLELDREQEPVPPIEPFEERIRETVEDDAEQVGGADRPRGRRNVDAALGLVGKLLERSPRIGRARPPRSGPGSLSGSARRRARSFSWRLRVRYSRTHRASGLRAWACMRTRRVSSKRSRRSASS